MQSLLDLCIGSYFVCDLASSELVCDLTRSDLVCDLAGSDLVCDLASSELVCDLASPIGVRSGTGPSAEISMLKSQTSQHKPLPSDVLFI